MQFEGRYVKPTNFFLNQLELFNSGTLSDFTIVVENKHKPVHKVLLAARSPVFAAMFSQKDSKEVREGKVVIPDFSFKAFKVFLAFVYIGLKPKQSPLTTELLKLADKVNNVVLYLFKKPFCILFDTIFTVFTPFQNSIWLKS